ncbi:CoA transferase subunit A [Robertmurraya andreesenii]|uniref:Glutaconate CoA-transferase subunit A n=1 Tax=Anoxybacillus andreesenii TaxID=1325932 RepID=A0ABT9V7F6_9BACL|nr:CoA-transferase [Robertmurraya andreesenii]MDQ0156859.1 glutaconate CoA-transferase subunit A [Robertmurraya andreesenii]
MKKLKSLKDAIQIINDGDMVSFGGNVLHRAPMAAVREIARQNKKNLRLVKTAGAQDIDLLCAMGCVESVDAGFVSYESKYGLANHYRKGVQSGTIKGNEHACYTVICALRGASMNVPFMPVKGLNAGDLLVENDYFVVVEDPFSGEPVTLVKSLVPDVAIIHVQECDEKGNAIIYGPKFEDTLLSRAAKKVIITAEQIVPETKTKLNAERVDIPGFLVDSVVHVPKGAAPSSCYKKYDIDDKSISSFIGMKTKEEMLAYLKSYEVKDYIGERMGRR